MKHAWLILISICLIAGCCAPIKLSEKNATILMAKEVEKEKGAKNITDAFTYEGNIYVYITFKWDDYEKPAGNYTIKAKWFNGGKLISVSEHDVYFYKSPWYVWLNTRGTNLGVGPCKVEVYADDIYLGSKSFTVKEI